MAAESKFQPPSDANEELEIKKIKQLREERQKFHCQLEELIKKANIIQLFYRIGFAHPFDVIATEKQREYSGEYLKNLNETTAQLEKLLCEENLGSFLPSVTEQQSDFEIYINKLQDTLDLTGKPVAGMDHSNCREFQKQAAATLLQAHMHRLIFQLPMLPLKPITEQMEELSKIELALAKLRESRSYKVLIKAPSFELPSALEMLNPDGSFKSGYSLKYGQISIDPEKHFVVQINNSISDSILNLDVAILGHIRCLRSKLQSLLLPTLALDDKSESKRADISGAASSTATILTSSSITTSSSQSTTAVSSASTLGASISTLLSGSSSSVSSNSVGISSSVAADTVHTIDSTASNPNV